MNNLSSSADKNGQSTGNEANSTSKVDQSIKDQRRGGIQIDLKPTCKAGDESALDEEIETTNNPTTPTQTNTDTQTAFVQADPEFLVQGSGSEISCPFCTYLNPPGAVTCDVCGNIFS